MRFLGFFLLLVLFSCKTAIAPAGYDKIDLETISDKEKQDVYSYGKKMIESCNAKKYIPLKGRKSGMTEDSENDWQKSCEELNKRNGKFIDMQLVEVIGNKELGNKVYRYIGKFERNDSPTEIRIWGGKEGKYQGIVWQEWKDDYIP